MPSSDAILAGLTALANDWRALAIAWHAAAAALVVAVLTGLRPTTCVVALLLTAPIVSVSALAWTSANPFNGTVFAALAVGLAAAARRLPRAPVRIAPAPRAVPGALLVAFGLTYPHFLETGTWTTYLFAAPFGLLPCPTLSVVIGATLVLGLSHSRGWSTPLITAGVVYGIVGTLSLGVLLDLARLAGAPVLGAVIAHDWTRARSVRATAAERMRRLPGDDFITNPLDALTHAITIRASRDAVWPWLAQMGAGTRAGWYSYDALDNGRTPSAMDIVPKLQPLSTGMIFPALPGATDGFTLLAFDPARVLLLGWLPSDPAPMVTWAFVLEDAAAGTRLIVRVRSAPGYTFFGLPWWLAKPIVTVVHFIMERRQLLGIAARVERQPAPNRGETTASPAPHGAAA